MAANQPPEKWTHTNIVFSHISRESIGMQRGKSDVLNTQDGRKFVINGKLAKEQDLSKNLIPGNSYRIVYSNTMAGGDHIVALSNNDTVFQALEASIAKWQKEQKEMIVAIFITLIVEAIALILIDRIGCRKLHAEIAKLKADIKRREAKIRGE